MTYLSWSLFGHVSNMTYLSRVRFLYLSPTLHFYNVSHFGNISNMTYFAGHILGTSPIWHIFRGSSFLFISNKIFLSRITYWTRFQQDIRAGSEETIVTMQLFSKLVHSESMRTTDPLSILLQLATMIKIMRLWEQRVGLKDKKKKGECRKNNDGGWARQLEAPSKPRQKRNWGSEVPKLKIVTGHKSGIKLRWYSPLQQQVNCIYIKFTLKSTINGISIDVTINMSWTIIIPVCADTLITLRAYY
jgi:hypothetical protein